MYILALFTRWNWALVNIFREKKNEESKFLWNNNNNNNNTMTDWKKSLSICTETNS